VKYSPGGGRIVVSVAEEQEPSPQAILTIQDGGLGIPEADLPHIFDRFRRGSNVNGQIPGTGIGLSGARQIVEQHGGSVSLESQIGVGTTVTVRLPRAAPSVDGLAYDSGSSPARDSTIVTSAE